MSATLTWYHSGVGTKTGTTQAAFFTDIVSLVGTKSGDANFKWEVASSDTAGNPNYVVLRRKDASAGRILIVAWTSAPAGNNAAILDAAPTANNVYVAWFPSGNVATPSNLNASSGTILGNDTGAVKVTFGTATTTVYTTNIQPFYFDSTEAMFFGFQNPASATTHAFGAGDLVVDGADAAYGATVSFGGAAHTFGSTSGPMPWLSATASAGTASQTLVRTNYGSSNRVYYQAWFPSANWANSVVSATDILTNTGSSQVWHVPVQLLGTTKGEGFVIKLRQIALGPGTVGAFTPYNITGPVVAARQFNAATAGGNGFPWFTNFKL